MTMKKRILSILLALTMTAGCLGGVTVRAAESNLALNKPATASSVANGCGIGVGTVYNYFSSKDMLIASFMAEDWLIRLKRMKLTLSFLFLGLMIKILIG